MLSKSVSLSRILGYLAKSSLLSILGKEVKGGQYYGPTGFNEMKGKAGLTTAFPQAYDENTAQKLWEISEKLVNQKFEI